VPLCKHTLIKRHSLPKKKPFEVKECPRLTRQQKQAEHREYPLIHAYPPMHTHPCIPMHTHLPDPHPHRLPAPSSPLYPTFYSIFTISTPKPKDTNRHTHTHIQTQHTCLFTHAHILTHTPYISTHKVPTHLPSRLERAGPADGP